MSQIEDRSTTVTIISQELNDGENQKNEESLQELATNKFSWEGTWTFTEIPEDFFEIMRLIGYNKLQRKWLRSRKVLIKSKLEGDILKCQVSVAGGLYRQTREFHLNGKEREFKDNDNNWVKETATVIDDHTIEIHTTYIKRNLTVRDRRKIISENECHYKVTLDHHDNDQESVETELVYVRANTI